MVKLGVAVPCYKYHIQKLKRCLDSIEAQTKKPDFVVVSSSSCEASDIPAEYIDGHYSFPLRILTFRNRQNASENRNIAAALCKFEGCTHISFFDCDDEMHPQRIEAIHLALKVQPDTHFIAHSFYEKEEVVTQPFQIYEGFQVVLNELRRSVSGCALLDTDWDARIHHSQCTVSTDIWNRIKYREAKELERREDAIFCGEVLLSRDVKTVYIRNPLSKYYFEGAWY